MARSEGDPARRGSRPEKTRVYPAPEIPIGEELDFSNRIVVITGGSRGIGRATAELFAGHGAHVIIVSTERSEAEAKETVDMIQGYRRQGLWVPGDVSQVETAERVMTTAMKEFGRVDILVNGAGIRRDNLGFRMKEEEWDQVIRTNLTAVWRMSRAASRPMMRQKKGVIVNIASAAGQDTIPGQANYAAAKAGVISLTKSFAVELAPFGIRVVAVAPGLADTKLVSDLTEEQERYILEKTPLGRKAEPVEVARGILFLASDAASYITGNVLSVSGGLIRG